MTSGAASAGDVEYEIEFAQARPDHRPYIGGLHRYTISVPAGRDHTELFLPAWANVRFLIDGGSWGIRFGEHNFDPVPESALFGPTLSAGFARVQSGQMVGAYLTPRGWARIVGEDASRYADRVVSMEQVFGDLAAECLAELRRAESFVEQVGVIEALVSDLLEHRPYEPPELARIEAALADPDITTVEQIIEITGISSRRFTRMTKRHFGFAPKLLMRRARFMRSILKIEEAKDQPWSSLIDPGYTDQSHFIRDCKEFLEMTPGQFASRPLPIARASFIRRREVMGSEHHLIDDAAAAED